MRTVNCILALFCFMPNAVLAMGSNGIHYDSLSTKELLALATSLPALPGTIQAIRIFRGAGKGGASVAFSTNDEKSGWQIFIFTPDNNQRYQLSWKSGKLDDSFQVSSASNLSVYNLDSSDGIVFRGCARHVCPDVFSILLYVPAKNRAFEERYQWGKSSYSFNIKDRENQKYKKILDELVSYNLPID